MLALVRTLELTERERAVLHYLPTPLTASEIAAGLFVSVNTVETHQRAIYRKLGVSSRRAAVDRARATRLLDTGPCATRLAGRVAADRTRARALSRC